MKITPDAVTTCRGVGMWAPAGVGNGVTPSCHTPPTDGDPATPNFHHLARPSKAKVILSVHQVSF